MAVTMSPDPPGLTVRTVTVFLTEHDCHPTRFHDRVSAACALANDLRKDLTDSDIPVQTIRISLPSPAVFLNPSAALVSAKALDTSPIDFVSLGTLLPGAPPAFLTPSFFSSVLAATSKVSLTLTTTLPNGVPSPTAVSLAAHVIRRLASIHPSGITNFRFAALANVRPDGPFFPASFSSSSNSSAPNFRVALGIQAATLLHQQPLQRLTARIETAATGLRQACKRVPDVTFDFSTAPLPGWETSAAAAIARFAGGNRDSFGVSGTLTAAASVATAIDRAVFPKAGFCGLMLAVAEDNGLAICREKLSLSTLLMTSAVCGTGLDTIPLPGDTPVEVLKAIVGDVTALSARLGGKQLTVRLLLVPGKKAGQLTEFDSPYIVNGPVLDVEFARTAVAGDDSLCIEPILSLR